MRRILPILGVLAVAFVLFAVNAPPAAATIVACSGHIEVAEYVTAAGNRYELNAHLCWEDLPGGEGRTRVHFHCQRNDAPRDACRIQTRVVTQFLPVGGSWTDDNAYAVDHDYPGGAADCTTGTSNSGYFTDSPTLLSNTGFYSVLVRAHHADPDSIRWCLADGTSVVDDIHVNAVGPQYQA